MPNNDMEKDTPTNPEGQNPIENEPTSEDVVVPESAKNLDSESQKQIDTIYAQKKHAQKKLEEREAELERIRKENEELKQKTASLELDKKPDPQPAQKQETIPDDEWKKRMEFTVAHRDFDQEDIDTAIAMAKGYGKGLEEVIDLPIFKAYQKEKTERKDAENTTPKPGPNSEPVDENFDFQNLQAGDISKMDSKTFERYQAWQLEREKKNK